MRKMLCSKNVFRGDLIWQIKLFNRKNAKYSPYQSTALKLLSTSMFCLSLFASDRMIAFWQFWNFYWTPTTYHIYRIVLTVCVGVTGQYFVGEENNYESIFLHLRSMKFSIKDFFSKCDQIRRKLRIWSHLLKKSLIENFMFCAV